MRPVGPLLISSHLVSFTDISGLQGVRPGRFGGQPRNARRIHFNSLVLDFKRNPLPGLFPFASLVSPLRGHHAQLLSGTVKDKGLARCKTRKERYCLIVGLGGGFGKHARHAVVMPHLSTISIPIGNCQSMGHRLSELYGGQGAICCHSGMAAGILPTSQLKLAFFFSTREMVIIR